MNTLKKAIITTFHPASSTKGMRISAKDGDNNRVTIDYPEHLEFGELRHRAAALALCEKMKWAGGEHLLAGLVSRNSYVFLFNEKQEQLGLLLTAYAELDELLDNVVGTMPEGLTKAEQAIQRRSNKVRDKALECFQNDL